MVILNEACGDSAIANWSEWCEAHVNIELQSQSIGRMLSELNSVNIALHVLILAA